MYTEKCKVQGKLKLGTLFLSPHHRVVKSPLMAVGILGLALSNTEALFEEPLVLRNGL
jgi:hypothetical protein